MAMPPYYLKGSWDCDLILLKEEFPVTLARMMLSLLMGRSLFSCK